MAVSLVQPAATLLATASVATDVRCFLDDFLFGSATASYQVEGAVKEGGRKPSIWDQFCRERPDVKCANVADDFYHRYKDDIQLMAKMGLQSFRFSISWSRAMNWDPALHGMRPNPEGIAFYHSLIDDLKSNGIKPILTLYHWDLPLELHTELSPQGWLNSDIVQHYAEFATLIFHEYGSKVNLGTTFNEPLSFTTAGYATGREAPGFTGSPIQVYAATHNVWLSHARAVQQFRELKTSRVINDEARIAIVLNADYAYPLDASNPSCIALQWIHFQFCAPFDTFAMFRFALTASSLLVAAVASAQECSSSVSETVIAKIDNNTYYETCAVEDEGVTFNISTLFKAWSLSYSTP
ncbi:Beta-glucosidase [Phytophthora megakarya]|uniref:Beta-glucosidase n=1 Tax=Phytophthora megakarya TaxID=4795 RepID=A0A225US67_9STRA|nr:Beta-glucosidase [Phytophthora megakarya]